MASRRRKGGRLTSSDIVVRWKGTIIITGPKSKETELRDRIEERISESLHRCPYLSMSGLADRYAFQIAWGAKFVAYRKEVARIEYLDVYYQNPPMYWKWWARFRQDRDTLVITGDYYHEGEGQERR